MYEDAVELPVVQKGVPKDLLGGKITQFMLRSGCVIPCRARAPACDVLLRQILGSISGLSQQYCRATDGKY